MHYLLQALDWLEPLVYVLGAGVGFWAFRRCRKVGFLLVALYFCLGVFSLLALPRIRAELDARRTPSVSEVTQQKINAAMTEAYERVMREEGMQPVAASRSIRFPFGPLLLVVGVWLLARREVGVGRSESLSAILRDEQTTT